jgi:hypothetical protein
VTTSLRGIIQKTTLLARITLMRAFLSLEIAKDLPRGKTAIWLLKEAKVWAR